MEKQYSRPSPLTKKQIIWLLVSIAVYIVLRVTPLPG